MRSSFVCSGVFISEEAYGMNRRQGVRRYHASWRTDTFISFFEHVIKICLCHLWRFFSGKSKTSGLGTIFSSALSSGLGKYQTSDWRNSALFVLLQNMWIYATLISFSHVPLFLCCFYTKDMVGVTIYVFLFLLYFSVPCERACHTQRTVLFCPVFNLLQVLVQF